MWWHPWQHSSWMLLGTAQTGQLQLQWNWSWKPTASRTAESQTSCTLIAQKSGCRADDYSQKLNIGLPAQVEKQAKEQQRKQESLRSEARWLHLIQPTVISGVTWAISWWSAASNRSGKLLNREKRGNIVFLCHIYHHTAKTDSKQQKTGKLKRYC